MPTKADQFRANALHEVGEDYEWGHEGTGGVAGNDDYDCSGFTWAMLNDVGVKIPRTTAEGYRLRGSKIAHPSRIGTDVGVLISNGRATHIAPFIGRDDVVEAKGEAYGVVKTSVKAFSARGAKWYRLLPGIDLGELTPDKPKATPRKYPGHWIKQGHKHHDEVRWVQKRLNAHGFKVAVDGSFGAKTADAVKAFRRKHGWSRIAVVGPTTWKALGL